MVLSVWLRDRGAIPYGTCAFTVWSTVFDLQQGLSQRKSGEPVVGATGVSALRTMSLTSAGSTGWGEVAAASLMLASRTACTALIAAPAAPAPAFVDVTLPRTPRSNTRPPPA